MQGKLPSKHCHGLHVISHRCKDERLINCRPEQLAANASELLVWLIATGTLRLYWHSLQLQQVPVSVLLSTLVKAACSVGTAVFVLFQHHQSWTGQVPLLPPFYRFH